MLAVEMLNNDEITVRFEINHYICRLHGISCLNLCPLMLWFFG